MTLILKPDVNENKVFLYICNLFHKMAWSS